MLVHETVVGEQRVESGEQRSPYIDMRIFASCGRGDLQIALCWCMRQRAESKKMT